ncbi:MAG: NAD-dependent epimerase/dehydratase family protein, partial [Planctomycetota bacterium]|nr:NAD-dependent epimerase/dehydratase family protein [Planctomycetota bacterium]
HTWRGLHHMNIAALRFFTVSGPRQRPDLAISRFMRQIAAGEPIRLFGDGATSRDYTFIDDIVSGVIAAGEEIHRHGWRIWNLGGNRSVTLRDLVKSIEKVVGARAALQWAETQPGDVSRTCADLTRSREELQYTPKTSLEDGLRRQWSWMQANAALAAAADDFRPMDVVVKPAPGAGAVAP